MIRKLASLIAAPLAALALPAAPAAAGITCSTDAASEIAGATVTGPRTDWTPPVWTFDMPDLSTSVDVQDDTQSGAASKAQAWLQSQVDAACQQAQPAQTQTQPSSTTSSTSATPATYTPSSQAQTLASTADVTYRGTDWGPTPLWTVSIPSLNMSVDVYATDAASARQAALATIDSKLGNSTTNADTSQVKAVNTDAAAAPAPTPPPTVTDEGTPAPNADDSPAAQFALLNG